MAVILRILVVFLKIGMAFVPEQKYVDKIRNIPDMDTKNKGFNLQGWDYRKLESPTGKFIHHYYYYPSSKADAPVFLLFHGLNLDGRTFLNLRKLSENYQLIAYDLPEKTDLYKGDFADFMIMVNEFVDLMEIRDCNVCGVSFGGSIALRLAVSRPDIKVRNLVLASTAIIGTTKSEQRERRRMSEWLKKQPDYKLYWFMEKVFERSARNYDDADTGRAVIEILRVKNPAFYRQVGVSMGTYDAREDAQKLACPVLWMLGDKDNLFSRKQLRKINTYVPHARIEVIHGGTHAMVLTRGEEIADKMQEFFSKTDSLNAK